VKKDREYCSPHPTHTMIVEENDVLALLKFFFSIASIKWKCDNILCT